MIGSRDGCRRTRGDLLERLGRLDGARAEFERAASLTQNRRERDLLLGRARGSSTGGSQARPFSRSR